ncbi:MAG: hypothetical protein L3J04_08905, partial [Robiginitomaculum sp.]|nr:hypothetical protein [Robiginitomaculum sp.]
AKRLEAVEIALRVCDKLGQLSMSVEFMKILNLEEISKRANDPDVHNFFEIIITSMNTDVTLKEVVEIDETLTKLYLNDHTLMFMDTYRSILTHAIMHLKLLSISVDNNHLLNKGILQEKIEKLVPFSKDGFKKYGEGHAYYWYQYFYDETLKSLRAEANGIDRDQEDIASIANITYGSELAQSEARSKAISSGLPPELIKSKEDIPETPH